MDRPVLKKENVKPLIETKYIKLADLQYEETGHYFSVTRRPCGEVPLLSDEEFRDLLPDAVSCFVIVKRKGEEPGLLLTKEFRYPCGQFLLSPPAGLIDKADIETGNALISAAKREIAEETGLEIEDKDRIFVVNPLCFSSPGMTDESNGMVCAVVERDRVDFNSDHTESVERIGDYMLVDRKEALKIIREGRDNEGIFFSVYTFMALMYFVSGLWEEVE